MSLLVLASLLPFAPAAEAKKWRWHKQDRVVQQQSEGISLQQAVRRARAQTGGKVIRAETVSTPNGAMHVIRVIDPRGKIHILRYPAGG